MPRGRKKTAAEKEFDAKWDGLRLPNSDCARQTPASMSIDLHYAQMHLWDRWDHERYIRLARLLNLTLYELASLACLNHTQIPKLEARNRLWIGHQRDMAGAMVLTIIEAHCAAAYSTDVVKSPFPNLGSAPTDHSQPSPLPTEQSRGVPPTFPASSHG